MEKIYPSEHSTSQNTQENGANAQLENQFPPDYVASPRMPQTGIPSQAEGSQNGHYPNQNPNVEQFDKTAYQATYITYPATGMPHPEIPKAGIPSPGMQYAGMPNPNMQYAGMPNPNMQYAGMPNPGMPYAGAPNPGMPNTAPYFFGSHPQTIICPFCRNAGQTNVYREAGTGTWLICLGLCFVTGCCGPLAFLIDSAQDIYHTCSTCGRQVGVKKLV